MTQTPVSCVWIVLVNSQGGKLPCRHRTRRNNNRNWDKRWKNSKERCVVFRRVSSQRGSEKCCKMMMTIMIYMYIVNFFACSFILYSSRTYAYITSTYMFVYCFQLIRFILCFKFWSGKTVFGVDHIIVNFSSIKIRLQIYGASDWRTQSL